jgi:hypothetical protein
MALAFFNPKGIAAPSPRLVRSAYLGSPGEKGNNRNAVVPNVARDGRTGMAATALRLEIFADDDPG